MKRLGFAVLMLGAVCLSSEAFAAKLCGCPLKKSSDRTMKNPCGDKDAAECGGVCFAQDSDAADAKAGFDAANKKVEDAKATGDKAAYDAAVKEQAQFMTENKIYGKICSTFAIGQAVSPIDPLGGYANLAEETDWDLLNEAAVYEQESMGSRSEYLQSSEPMYLQPYDGGMNQPIMPVNRLLQ